MANDKSLLDLPLRKPSAPGMSSCSHPVTAAGSCTAPHYASNTAQSPGKLSNHWDPCMLQFNHNILDNHKEVCVPAAAAKARPVPAIRNAEFTKNEDGSTETSSQPLNQSRKTQSEDWLHV